MRKRITETSKYDIREIKSLLPSRELSYRSYKNIPHIWLKYLDEQFPELSPKKKHFAIILRKKLVTSINDAVALSNHHWEMMPFKGLEKRGYVIKELANQGFIPINKYKVNPRYSYITTNFLIDGEYWIYPKKFGHSWKQIQKGYPLIEDYLGEYGVQGYIRILYGNN